ncbi:hypothetical protein BDZ45DRAFT_668905 [Acephala macrosclerotiorum]|nr:hypothetical protein BDZ45DRAFT_668905 [Acephala macrosclerotiorum]
MSCGLIPSTKAHLATLSSRNINQQSVNNQPDFPDSRFLSAARKCQNSPHSLRIRTPTERLLKFGSTYIHTHTADIQDLIQTFLDEYGCNKIMEVCETEIVLEQDLEELLISVGEGSRGRGACCSLRLLRPELGCRISLDIQTNTRTTRWPLRQTRETQVVCLALESLTPSPFSTPVKTSNSQSQQAENKKGKVYVCWEWKAVRVGGCSFLWGKDLVVDAVPMKKGRSGFFKRVVARVKIGALGKERRGKGEVEQELKPLLF